MYDFETLVGDLLGKKPQLDRETLLRMVKDKKATVGAGFLTDQGALFLIAGELGVQLRDTYSSDLTLRDLYVGANDITIVARVLAVYPSAKYTKKDGSGGRYLRINLFDGEGLTRLTAWDENVELLEELGLKIDTPIRVVSGYVRQGLDGKPNLNLGRKGKVEVVEDAEVVARLVPLSKLEKKVSEFGNGQTVLAVRGKLGSEVKKASFTRDDGSAGAMTQFRISSEDKEVKVVIWNDAPLPEMRMGQAIRVTNLRSKAQGGGETELHGDNGSSVTLIEETDAGPSKAVRPKDAPVKIRDLGRMDKPITVDAMALSKGSVREVPLRDGTFASKGEVRLGDDSGEILLVAWRSNAPRVLGIEPGERLLIAGLRRLRNKLGGEALELTDASVISKKS